jgi:hypothetical protein
MPQIFIWFNNGGCIGALFIITFVIRVLYGAIGIIDIY